jgi:hypothetical protein
MPGEENIAGEDSGGEHLLEEILAQAHREAEHVDAASQALLEQAMCNFAYEMRGTGWTLEDQMAFLRCPKNRELVWYFRKGNRAKMPSCHD